MSALPRVARPWAPRPPLLRRPATAHRALPPLADVVPSLVEFEARLNPAVAVAALVAAAPPIIFWARIAMNARRVAAAAASAEAAEKEKERERKALLDRLNGKQGGGSDE